MDSEELSWLLRERGQCALKVFVQRSHIRDEELFYLALRTETGFSGYATFEVLCSLFHEPVEGAHELRQKWPGYRLFPRIVSSCPNMICFPSGEQADRFAMWFFREWNAPLAESDEDMKRLCHRYLHLCHDDIKKLLEEIEASAGDEKEYEYDIYPTKHYVSR